MTITEHPTYGTCTGCTQGKRIDKHGRIPAHKRTMAEGNALFTFRCPGSGRAYAEANRTEWNPRLSRWQDMPLQVDALMHTAGDGQPEEIYVEVFPSTDAKRGHARFKETDLSIHFLPVFAGASEEPTSFRTELRNRDDRIVREWPEEANDGDSVSLLVLRLMEQIGKEDAAVKS